MSGGHFNYIQRSSDLENAIREILNHILKNEEYFDLAVIDSFIAGLDHIEKAKIYLEQIDRLLSGDSEACKYYLKEKEQ